MKKNKLVCLVCMISLISLMSLIGCQQEEPFDEVCDNGDYLSLPSNVNYNQLTSTEFKILAEAFVRLDIRINEDGLFEIIQNSSMNMSEELFAYFLRIIESTNESILSDIHFTRNRVQTRQEGDEYKTDCVAWSISYATGQSYSEVNSWITNNYGDDGVKSSDFYNVMNHFSNGVQVSFSKFRDMTITTNKKYVIVINLTHAVNVVAKDGDNIFYYDKQNNRSNICSVNDVTHIYEIR